MAKAFYTQDEAKDALNTDDEGLKTFVSEGRLTEYRDGANLMYKGSQVEGLASELGASDEIGMSDTGGPIGLADSGAGAGPGASGSAIAMEDSYGGIPGPEDSAAASSDVVAQDDTGSFALTDTGNLSNTGTNTGTSAGASGGSLAGASASGITIFEDDDVDPSAQTNIGASDSSDQVNLEGIGSGSGLLDLTQEPDDTSFGAETFDEIMPEGSVSGGTVSGLDIDDGGIDTAVAPAGTRPVGVAYEPYDPSAPIFGGLAGGAAVVALLGLLAVALSALNAAPGFLSPFMTEGDASGANIPLLALIFGVPILGAIIGFIGGKMASSS